MNNNYIFTKLSTGLLVSWGATFGIMYALKPGYIYDEIKDDNGVTNKNKDNKNILKLVGYSLIYSLLLYFTIVGLVVSSYKIIRGNEMMNTQTFITLLTTILLIVLTLSSLFTPEKFCSNNSLNFIGLVSLAATYAIALVIFGILWNKLGGKNIFAAIKDPIFRGAEAMGVDVNSTDDYYYYDDSFRDD